MMKTHLLKASVFCLALAAILTGCRKDELTETDLADGKISDKYEVIPVQKKCIRKTVKIDLDSTLSAFFSSTQFPLLQKEFCDCDTIDLEVVNLPDSLILIGLVEHDEPIPIFGNKKSNITETWSGDVLIAGRSNVFDYSFSLLIDFDECEQAFYRLMINPTHPFSLKRFTTDKPR